ncbi:hypothetical protein HRbin36_00795 [bacterium HR36]|nr:hypothetical protein HRbin36_00795 [bacterium HR36]
MSDLNNHALATEAASAALPPAEKSEVAEDAQLLEKRLKTLEDTCAEVGERVLRLESNVEQLQRQVQGVHDRQEQIQHELQEQKSEREQLGAVVQAPSWLILDMWRDVRLTWNMFRDPRYRVAWTTVVLSLGALIYLTVWPAVRSWVGWGWSIPGVGYIDNLIAAYLGLKALSRELRNYENFLSVRGAR